MNVREILSTVSQLSLGLDTPGQDDFSIYLGYLNLIHADLYRKTFTENPYAVIGEQGVTVNNGVVNFSDNDLNAKDFIKIIRVRLETAPQIYLEKGSYDWDSDRNPDSLRNRKPFYYFSNNSLRIVPTVSNVQATILYFKNPEPFSLDTTEDQIPYPPLYHQVLVDGVCDYLTLGESTFKNAPQLYAAAKRFKEGKSELLSYFSSLGAPASAYSTYSEV